MGDDNMTDHGLRPLPEYEPPAQPHPGASPPDIVAFLRARLDEDEQTARDAAAWWEAACLPGEAPYWRLDSGMRIKNDRGIDIAHEVMDCSAAHIARHDPARALVDVEAKRRLVDVILRYEAKIDSEWGCCCDADEIATGQCKDIDPSKIEGLRLLALPYADHSDYLEEWRP